MRFGQPLFWEKAIDILKKVKMGFVCTRITLRLSLTSVNELDLKKIPNVWTEKVTTALLKYSSTHSVILY